MSSEIELKYNIGWTMIGICFCLITLNYLHLVYSLIKELVLRCKVFLNKRRKEKLRLYMVNQKS